jgi:transposase
MAAERHLLLGLLALQTGLIQPTHLVAAFHAWTCDKPRSLAEHLIALGHLSTRPEFAYNSIMIRIQLDSTTRDDLQQMRCRDLPAKVRDRLEMVLLADAGWAPARLAEHLGYGYRTALSVLNDFSDRGRDALYPRRRGPAPDTARREQVVGLLHDLLGQDRVWTSAQLAEALLDRGVALSPRQVRRYLRGMRSRYRRTAGTIGHKQDPEDGPGRGGPRQPHRPGRGGAPGPVLPRRVRLRPVAADRLQLVSARPVQEGPL